MDVKLVNIPERVRIQNRGLEISDAIPGPDKNIGAREANYGQILRDNFLNPVIQALALRRIERDKLLLHETVHFRFPGSGGSGLVRVPQMSAAGGKPNVHLGIGIRVAAAKPHDAGLEIVGVEEAVHDAAKFERDNVDIHSELLQVVL